MNSKYEYVNMSGRAFLLKGILMIVSLLLSLSVVRAQSINLNTNDLDQLISMIGGDMERSGPNFLNAANQEEIIQWCVGDIPCDTWRVRYDKKQEMEEGVYNWATYTGDVLAMQMMLEVNPNLKFFATMKSDYHGYSEGNRNNLPTFIYDYAYNSDGTTSGTKSFDTTKYGVFLADYVEFMELSGVPITYLSTSKEWQVVTAARAEATLTVMKSELNTRGIAIPLIIDPCSWSLTRAYNVVNEYTAQGLLPEVYGFSSHNYWSNETKTWGDFASAAQAAGKYAFADETGHGGGGLSTGEVSIERALGSYVQRCLFYEGGIEGEQIFEIWPRGYNELNDNGFYAKPIFFDGGSQGVRMRAYYLMKKFITEAAGRTYISSSLSGMSDVYTMAFGEFGSDDEVALWVINNSATAYNALPINVTNFGLKSGMLIEKTSWDASTAIEGAVQNIVTSSNNQITANIGAQSLNCFVIRKDYKLTPYYRINSASWVGNQTDLGVAEGDTLKFGPQSSVNGTWTWSGPNGFSATTREIELVSMTPSMAGDYIATYTNPDGNTSGFVMSVQMDCNTTPTTTPYYRINGGSWVSDTTPSISTGDSIEFGPHAAAYGSWEWVGPNGFYADTREIELGDISADMEGVYVATNTSPAGCSAEISFVLSVSCDSPPVITPYSRIDGTVWTNDTNVTVTEGGSLEMGPQSGSVGLWDWSGSNGYSARMIREVTLEDISAGDAGDYTVTRTTPDGCTASVTFTVTVEAAGPFVPDPSKVYYIDVPAHGLRLAADGESEDAYMTSTTETGEDVRWQFVDKGNGYWHIDRAAGGSKPRLRSDNSEFADMQPTSSSGSYTYYAADPGHAYGTYFLTLPSGPAAHKRLQVDGSGVIRMVSEGAAGAWESFTFTEATTPVLIHIEAEDYTAQSGINTETTTDVGGGENVGWINAGDYMEYSITIPTAGTYNVDYRVASRTSGGDLSVTLNGSPIDAVTFASTGGWQNWTTVTSSAVFAAGTHTLRIEANAAGWNINWFDVYEDGAK